MNRKVMSTGTVTNQSKGYGDSPFPQVQFNTQTWIATLTKAVYVGLPPLSIKTELDFSTLKLFLRRGVEIKMSV